VLCVALIIVPLLSACGSLPPVEFKAIPIPPGGKEEPIEGGFEVAIDNSTFDIWNRMKDLGYSPITDYRYIVFRDGTEWEAVRNFYATKLGSEWVADDELQLAGNRYSYVSWKRGSQILIVDYVDWEPDFRILVLMVTGT
jgi:hypothetical protein